ncbi:FAD-binding oxidoreductase [Chondromyces apiculatus]|uniref:FAD linked oxidase-like protein n=1 Tax=Chondromyces apiculatus DSM 436 TaxID=1192034 RepID=A0A017TJ78_9BACT|nr:FAD-binding oxidoreductase [Chondromyces apiculatus]EYF08895.1 FAD linked oxidase-like protein [Chondromyces apiculatus DSM 436]
MSEQRAHNFWGWGYADRFPDLDTRRGLGEQVGALLGAGPLVPRDPPARDAITLPAPRIAPPSPLAHLGSAAPHDRITHTHGRGYRDILRGFRGDFASAPDWVAYPATEQDIEALLAWCSQARITVVPFGGGTSVVGGVEPRRGPSSEGVISLDLRRLDRVLDVDPLSRAARIQAGARGPAIEAQLAPHGLTLRHYPQSFEFSTLGGWIATRAGGHFATLHTHIDDFVSSIRMLTPAGVYATPRLPASGAGPSPDRLALGSEGILGVITEAWLRVQARPRYRASASVSFPAFAEGAAAARAIAQAGLYPANCRLIDRTEMLLNGVPSDGDAVLLLGFESSDHPLGPWIDRALALAAEHGGRCPEGPRLRDDGARGAAAAASTYRESFFQAPYLQTALVSLGVIADTFETACTWDRFEALHAAVQAAAREAGAGALACRFTHVYPDGPAPYYTFLAAAPPGEEIERWTAIRNAATDALAAAGGTITHHHAVGRLHRPWYDRERPDPFALALRAAKRALDPQGILNPGVLIDV